ncbi:MAG: glycosyltransferase family 39 protein [Chloroflexota bacterium]|nr:glycosyltransferase family 39 protein [Chloroflexota bacterium]
MRIHSGKHTVRIAEEAAKANNGQRHQVASPAQLSHVDARNLLLLAGTCAFVLLLIPPQHEYPVLDDWIYAGSVRTMLETGAFVHPGMAQPNLVGLTLWGTLWTTLFGFSFTTLTYSTLAFSAVALLSFYGIARAVDVPPLGALLGTWLLAFNPFFLHLSYTFMTEVPFISLMLLSCYLYIRGLQRQQSGWLLVGGFFAGWSYLIRQFGILVPVAFALYVAVQGFRARRWPSQELVAILALPLLTLSGWYAFQAWQGPGDSGAAEDAARRTSRFMWQEPWPRVIGLRMLNFLPLLALFAWTAVRIQRSRWWLVPLSLLILLGGMYALDRPDEQWITITEEPYTVNVGPLAMQLPQETYTFGTRGNILRTGGIDFFQYRQEPIWTPGVWRFLWVLCAGLAALLLAKMLNSFFDWVRDVLKTNKSISPVVALYLLGVGIFAVSVAFVGESFDRHLLSVVPFLLLFMVRGTRHWGKFAWGYAMLALAMLAGFSMLLKADMVSHDNARWQAALWLAARAPGVQAGFDWDNWTQRVNTDYRITDLDLPGYRIERRFPYNSLLSGGTTRYVLATVREDLPALP